MEFLSWGLGSLVGNHCYRAFIVRKLLTLWEREIGLYITHQSSCLVVMQIDSGLNVACFFSTINEELREVYTKFEIVRAATPLPTVIDRGRLMFGVAWGVKLRYSRGFLPCCPCDSWTTATLQKTALATSSSNAVGYTSWRDGVSECTLPIPCQHRYTTRQSSWLILCLSEWWRIIESAVNGPIRSEGSHVANHL